MSARRESQFNVGEPHMARVKEENVDGVKQEEEEQQQQQQQQQEEKGQEVVGKTLDASLLVGIGTKRARRTSREMMDDGDFQVQSPSNMYLAKEFQANLNPELPSFIRLMRRVHVTRGFWLGLPTEFCKHHMPKHDETVVLVGENGEEHRANFVASRSGLGWREFSLAHELRRGDVVVFQLVRRCKFKVYIVRGNAPADVDGVTGHRNLDANAKESSIETDNSFVVVRDQSENCREDSLTESMDCLNNAGSFVDIQSFTIIVNGFAIDSELAESLRTKYYELCCSRKSYLHDRLLKSINPRLAAGIISETVNIADAIRACKLFTSQDDFAVWDKTLEGFELLGMDVGFLRSRLNQLATLAVQSGETPDFKKYNKATLERTCLEEEITSFEKTLNRLKDAKNTLDSQIDTLKANVQRYELKFNEAAHSPW